MSESKEKLLVCVVLDYLDTRFSNLQQLLNIFAKRKNFAKPFSPAHIGPMSNLLSKKIVKISRHCPFNGFRKIRTPLSHLLSKQRQTNYWHNSFPSNPFQVWQNSNCCKFPLPPPPAGKFQQRCQRRGEKQRNSYYSSAITCCAGSFHISSARSCTGAVVALDTVTKKIINI